MLENLVMSLQETYGVATLAIGGGLLVGLLFGWLAEASGFCLRSAVVETTASAAKSRPVKTTQFLAAMAGAIAFTQLLVLSGILDLSQAVAIATPLSLAALVIGGVLFGVGMVLAGGCVARLLVLATTGNLRAGFTILIIAVAAYATLRGALAFARVGIEGAVPSEGLPTTLVALTGLDPALVASLAFVLVSAAVLVFARRAGLVAVAIGAGVGALVAAAWFVTGVLAFDEFEPARPMALTFTAPVAESLQYLMISTGDTLRFSIALVGGVMAGSFLSAAVSGRLRLQGFQTESAPIRYAAGGLLMGFGGVLALGCTIGQGLSGVSTLAIGPFIALAAIVAGARLTLWYLASRRQDPAAGVSAERGATVVPAE